MIRFSKYIWLYMIISALVLVPGVYSLVRWGLHPSIDFTGGTLVELKTDEKTVQEYFPTTTFQKTSSDTYILRLQEGNVTIPASLSANVIRDETVGPVLGAELLQKTVTAALIAMFAILAYVAYAFKNIKFGISAVIALIHDLLVVIGLFSLFGHWWGVEIDTLFVTAFLTTMSFSVHDTIVVFDRIREMLKRGERLPFDELCDKAMTETIGRSTANSFTIIFMLLALALLGGETVRWFVIALLIGTVSGTYSSPFVATPVLILWDRWENRKRIKK
jgi:preprotein translocase subunit SecF